ncbi:MAG TPA: ABC transporter permease [Trebonia sp.]|nr:ABC transporter permease [Trebonia sp.]
MTAPMTQRLTAASPGRGRRSRRRPMSPARRWTLRLASVAAILIAWQIYGGSINPILLSDPSAVAVAFVDMVRDGSLGDALASSLEVLGLGFLFGAVAGVVIGLAAGRSETVAALIDLPVNALYAVPAVALVPVIVLWFGFAVTTKTVVVFLFVVFPVLINTLRGVREVDPELVEVARSFCSSERRMWFDLILPSALPFIVTGLRLAIGRALIGVIIAEFYTSLSGLGDLITTNASNFQTARMFVPIVVIALLGVFFTALLELAERRLVQWRKAPQ